MWYFRCSIVLCACAAFLAGCGGDRALFPVGSSANMLFPPSNGSQTFDFTGVEQMFTVPSAVKHVTITASGASGGICVSSCDGFGTSGSGGLVKATIPVTPGETLYVFVGGDNGYNGGGDVCSTDSCYRALSGGGASDVRQGGTGLTNRVVVAAGGGGAGYIPYSQGVGGNGGAGGGKFGTAGGTGYGYVGSGSGGGPGTQLGGGPGGKGGSEENGRSPLRCRDGCGGCNGATGAAGSLGAGGDGATSCGGPGGGGGGGYYGGGGGGSGGYSYYGVSFQYGAGGGGGGGSSFVEKKAVHVKDKTGRATPGNGQIVISW